MRDWRSQPPETLREATLHRREILATMQEYIGNNSYSKCFPEPGDMQTPWKYRRKGTGMKEREFGIIQKYIKEHKGYVWSFWLDCPIISPAILKEFTNTPVDPHIWIPWIPRLDAIFITDKFTVSTCEVVNTVTAGTIGELITKTTMYLDTHPHSPNLRNMTLIYAKDNPLVRTLFIYNAPEWIKQTLIFQQIKPSLKRMGEAELSGESQETPGAP